MQQKVPLTESFRNMLNCLDTILLEASYDGMIAAMNAKYPEQQKLIADQLKWAKSTFKKDEKIVWYMKQVAQSLPNSTEDLAAIQNKIGPFFGASIPAIDNYQFGKKSSEEIIKDLTAINDNWQQKQSQKKSNLPPIPTQQGDHEFMKFPDGSSWWWVDRAYCDIEAKYGRHCGNEAGKANPDQRILSLRKNGQILLTFVLEPNGKLGEMKSSYNQKPPEKYHPQILALLLSDKIKGIEGSDYLSDHDFSVFDLSDAELKQIQSKKPSLIQDQLRVSPSQARGAPPWIRKMYINDLNSVSSGLKYLIDPKTGEYTDNPSAWNKAISEDPTLALNIPSDLINEYKSEILNVLSSDPTLLTSQASRDIRRNFDILKEFVTSDDSHIGYVQPSTPRYKELCEIAVEHDGHSLFSIPEELITPELSRIAVSRTGKALAHVPKKLITSELSKIAVSQNGLALADVPKKLITAGLSEIAVSQNPWSLYFVPDRFKTPELCKFAVSQDGRVLKYVPKELITPALEKLAKSNI